MNYLRVLLVIVAGWLAHAQTCFASPFCLPPAAPDAGIMRAAPEECLFYLGWNGAGKPDAKSENQTEQLLAEDEIQKFISQIDAQVTALVQQAMRGNPAGAALAEHLPALVKTVLTRPAAIYVSKVTIAQTGPDVRAGVVVNTGDQQPAFAKAIAQIEALALSQLPPGMKFEETNVAGAVLRHVPAPPGAPVVVWGFKDSYFLISVGVDAGQELVGRLASQAAPPAWLTKVQEQASVDRPGTTWYVNLAGILQTARPFMTDPKIAAALDALGLQNVTSISSVSGFDGAGMEGKTLIATEGELKGVFAAMAGKPLAAGDLQPIPKDATMAIAARLDLGDVLPRVLEGIGKIDPATREKSTQALSQLDAQLGFSLKDDLLAALGDVWCAYSTEPKAAATKAASPAGNMTLTVTLRDRKRLDKSYPVLLKLLQQQAEKSDGVWTVKQSTFRGTQVYYVPLKLPQAPAAPVPVPLSFDALSGAVTPCWCLTENRLVVSLNPQGLKDFLTRDAKSESLATRPELSKWFASSGGPSLVSLQDTAATLRSSYPALQAIIPAASLGLASQGLNVQLPALPSLATLERHARPSIFVIERTAVGLLLEDHQTVPVINSRSLATTGVGIALLLPAVQAAREAARRTQSTNNLKQIGLAMHNFHDVYKFFPAAAGYDQQSKPTLSWRVYILPYLEQQELYNSFHLEEPWDSEHNKALIARMPVVYLNPNLPSANEGKTNYLAVVGEKMAINPKQGTGMVDMTDGTSNTIMVVEANADRAVVWTKPDDWTPDDKNPLAGLIGLRPASFLALFADGSVHLISEKTDANILKALFTRNGGEVIPPGAVP